MGDRHRGRSAYRAARQAARYAIPFAVAAELGCVFPYMQMLGGSVRGNVAVAVGHGLGILAVWLGAAAAVGFVRGRPSADPPAGHAP